MQNLSKALPLESLYLQRFHECKKYCKYFCRMQLPNPISLKGWSLWSKSCQERLFGGPFSRARCPKIGARCRGKRQFLMSWLLPQNWQTQNMRKQKANLQCFFKTLFNLACIILAKHPPELLSFFSTLMARYGFLILFDIFCT